MYNAPPQSSLSHFAPHVAQQVDGPIRVRAIMKGFYNNTLRLPGDEFGIHSLDEKGPWMELLEAASPERPLEPDAPAAAAAAPATASKPEKHSGKRHTKAENDVL